jgi:DNA-binding MarR family transcriptional regulator
VLIARQFLKDRDCFADRLLAHLSQFTPRRSPVARAQSPGLLGGYWASKRCKVRKPILQNYVWNASLLIMSQASTDVSEVRGIRETASRLRVAIGAFKHRVRETQGAGELSVPQLAALSRLDRLGAMTTAELARREQITPQAMGNTIASLEKLDLVARRADAADGRLSILSLTPEGLEAVRSGRNAVVDRIVDVLGESFTDEETGVLTAAAPLIERLADLL